MNRLTKKNKNILTNDIEKYIINPFEELKTINKLGQLEDIEEELGIDFITLFKALKDGVYTKRRFYAKDSQKHYTFDECDKTEKVKVSIKSVCCPDWSIENPHTKLVLEVQGSMFYELQLKDYCKTWALIKGLW